MGKTRVGGVSHNIYVTFYVYIEYGLQAKPSILYRGIVFSPQPGMITIIIIGGLIIILSLLADV